MTAKRMAKKTNKTIAKGTANYIKYMIAYSLMAAAGAFVVSQFSAFGIELPLNTIAIGAIAYFAVGTFVLHRKLTIGRVIKLGRGLGILPKKLF